MVVATVVMALCLRNQQVGELLTAAAGSADHDKHVIGSSLFKQATAPFYCAPDQHLPADKVQALEWIALSLSSAASLKNGVSRMFNNARKFNQTTR